MLEGEHDGPRDCPGRSNGGGVRASISSRALGGSHKTLVDARRPNGEAFWIAPPGAKVCNFCRLMGKPAPAVEVGAGGVLWFKGTAIPLFTRDWERVEEEEFQVVQDGIRRNPSMALVWRPELQPWMCTVCMSFCVPVANQFDALTTSLAAAIAPSGWEVSDAWGVICNGWGGRDLSYLAARPSFSSNTRTKAYAARNKIWGRIFPRILINSRGRVGRKGERRCPLQSSGLSRLRRFVITHGSVQRVSPAIMWRAQVQRTRHSQSRRVTLGVRKPPLSFKRRGGFKEKLRLTLDRFSLRTTNSEEIPWCRAEPSPACSPKTSAHVQLGCPQPTERYQEGERT